MFFFKNFSLYLFAFFFQNYCWKEQLSTLSIRASFLVMFLSKLSLFHLLLKRAIVDLLSYCFFFCSLFQYYHSASHFAYPIHNIIMSRGQIIFQYIVVSIIIAEALVFILPSSWFMKIEWNWNLSYLINYIFYTFSYLYMTFVIVIWWLLFVICSKWYSQMLCWHLS